MQARKAQEAAKGRGGTTEDAALEELAAAVAAQRNEEEKAELAGTVDGFVIATETKAFVDGLKVEDAAAAKAEERPDEVCTAPMPCVSLLSMWWQARETVSALQAAAMLDEAAAAAAEAEAAAAQAAQEAAAEAAAARAKKEAEEARAAAASTSGWTSAEDGGWSSGAVDPSSATAALPEPKLSRAARRLRQRGGEEAKKPGKDKADAGDASRPAPAMLLFEGQKRLGKGLYEALVMVRERGWLHGVEYSGRQSDFKGNQQAQARALHSRPLLRNGHPPSVTAILLLCRLKKRC